MQLTPGQGRSRHRQDAVKLLGKSELKRHTTPNPRMAKPRAFQVCSSALGGYSISRPLMAASRSSYPDSGQVRCSQNAVYRRPNSGRSNIDSAFLGQGCL